MGRHLRFALAIWIGLASLVAGPAARAQNAEPKLADDRFYERLDEWGRVSGDIVMGVMIGVVPKEDKEDGKDEEKEHLADFAPRMTADVAVLRLPERHSEPDAEDDEARLFCVRINSKDGRFEAENTYSVAGSVTLPGGPFRYEGKHEPILTAIRAVSLVKVGRCGDRTEEVVPSVWNGTALAPERLALHVFVNSAGNPTTAVVGSDPGFVTCDDVADASTLKYTASCIFSFETLEAHRQDGRVPVTVHVTRSLGEESFKITIVLPDDTD